jgi:hypothetical protein
MKRFLWWLLIVHACLLSAGVCGASTLTVETNLVLSKAQGLQRLPEFTKRHDAFIEQIGVTKEQIFFKKTSLLMSQGSTNPQAGPVKKTDPVVRGATTHVVRAVDGIIVEGSSAKVTSFSADNIDAVRLSWPRMQLHPGIRSYETKSHQVLKQAIADRVKAIAGRERANVKMAVVLLPVVEGGTTYMVPVMKVAVRTDSAAEGAIFYEGLLTQGIQIKKPVTDPAAICSPDGLTDMSIAKSPGRQMLFSSLKSKRCSFIIAALTCL